MRTVPTMMVASLEPLTRRLEGTALCAGSHATAVIHLRWPAQACRCAACELISARVAHGPCTGDAAPSGTRIRHFLHHYNPSASHWHLHGRSAAW